MVVVLPTVSPPAVERFAVVEAAVPVVVVVCTASVVVSAVVVVVGVCSPFPASVRRMVVVVVSSVVVVVVSSVVVVVVSSVVVVVASVPVPRYASTMTILPSVSSVTPVTVQVPSSSAVTFRSWSTPSPVRRK